MGLVLACAAVAPCCPADAHPHGMMAHTPACHFGSYPQKEPQPCPACAGNGGTVCFACSGSGKSSAPLEAVAAQQQRDPLGGSSRSKRQCNVW